MNTIGSKDQIGELESDRALITVYLDRGYNEGVTAAILSKKRAFDNHVRDAWHMLIPYCDGAYALDEEIHATNYGIELAGKIIDEGHIPTDKLPAILFPDYSDAGEFYYISLAGMDPAYAVRMIGRIGDIVLRHHTDGRAEPNEFRFDVTQSIKRDVLLQRLISFARRHLEAALAAIGIAIPFAVARQ